MLYVHFLHMTFNVRGELDRGLEEVEIVEH